MFNDIKPDRAEISKLVGLTLSKAFEQLVLNSEEVVEAIERAKATDPDFEGTAALTKLWKGRWPLQHDIENTIDQICGSPKSGKPSPSRTSPDREPWIPERRGWLPEVDRSAEESALSRGPVAEERRAVYRVGFQRFELFLDLLRSGALAAAGRSVTGSMIDAIDMGYWSATKYRLHIADNELGFVEGRKWVPKFEAVELRFPLSTGSYSPPKQINTGGNPGKHQWLTAADIALVRWLDSKDPDSASELVDWMENAFEQERATVPDRRQIEKWLAEKLPRVWAKAKAKD